jgi:DNA-binding SARP family transcriptional activator
MLKARLFGPLALEIDGRPVPEIAGLRPRSVLAWLLLEPGSHGRAHVAARFWPEVLDTSARASLRNVLSTIRAALDAAGGSAYLQADRASVGVDPALAREVDVERFGELARAADTASLERAFALADAPLLSDLADDWVLEARDDYRDRLVDVALRLAEGAEADGDRAGAVLWTRRALAHARLREAVHRTLMRRLAAAGERAEALEAYARLGAILAAEFGTPPSRETRVLADALRTATPARSAPSTAPAIAEPPPRAPGAGGPPLVGRDHELDVVVGAWERARDGAGGVALITGAPGVGKSRVVAELGRHVTASGGRRAEGAGLELDGAPPLAPWSDALHELIEATPAPPADAVWPDDLARVCHAVETKWGRHAARSIGEPEFERIRVFEAIVAALGWCARDQPLLLVLEDLHLMDAASVALLAAAGRRLATVPVLVAATARPGDKRVVLALDDLRRRGSLAAELALAPLAEAEIAEIVDGIAPGLGAGERRVAIAAAGGIPLLAREAARAATAGGDLGESLGDWLRAPLVRLSASARRLVDLAAAAGRPLERGEAAQLVGAERMPQALDEACRAHLLDVREDRRIGFEHALVREASYAALAPARRAWMHADLADVLLARSSRSVAEIARHLLLARRDDEAGSYLAAAAADARRLGLLEEAAGFLREATAAAGSEALQAELCLLLADVESWRGDRAAYERAFTDALVLLERGGDAAALAAAHVARGRCLRTTLCFPRDALGAYDRALTIIDAGAIDVPELRTLALAGLAWAEAIGGDVGRAHTLIATVEALPAARDDPALAGELELDRAAALMRAGRFADSEEPSRRAAALAHASGRLDLHHVALINAAAAAAACGDASGALDLAEQASAIDGVGTRPAMEATAARAYALSRLDRHVEARVAAGELTALAARSGDLALELTSAFDAGSIALAAGDGPAAAASLEEAFAHDGGRVPRALARLRLAEARLLAGEPDVAGAELERVPFEPVGPADVPDALAPRLRRLQGLLAAERGEVDEALTRLAQSETGWRSLFGAALTGDAFAATFVDLGRPPVAGQLEPGVELGRVLAERGLLLASHSDGAIGAREALAEAAQLADRLSFEGYRGTLNRAAQAIEIEV